MTAAREATSSKIRWLLAVLVLGLSMLPHEVAAARGVVVYKRSGCDYYIVNANRGFALLQWYGGNDPDKGDELAGDFESYGFKTIQNLTRDTETRVWVDDYMLSQSSVVAKYKEKCRM